jgi:hypothetical protein
MKKKREDEMMKGLEGERGRDVALLGESGSWVGIEKRRRDMYCRRRRSELSGNEITFLPPLHFAAKPPLKSLVPSPTTTLAFSLSLSLSLSRLQLLHATPIRSFPLLASIVAGTLSSADSIPPLLLPPFVLIFIHVFIPYIEDFLFLIPLRLVLLLCIY